LVTVSDLVGCTISCGAPLPMGVVCRREIWVQTAVKRRNEMQQDRRSMAGTTLTVTSSARFFLLPPASGIAPPPLARPRSLVFRPPLPAGEGIGERVGLRYSTASSIATPAGIFILSLLATIRLRTPTADSLMSSTMVCVRPCRTE